MARGDVPVSPWTWSAEDYKDRKVSISIVYDNATRAVQSAQVIREAGCLYGKIYFDVPDSGRDKVLTVADGATRNFTQAQMAAAGLNVIEDITAVQITAGP